MLIGPVADDWKALHNKKAAELQVPVEVPEITPALACGASVPDHVHLFVSTDPTKAPQRLANQFKGCLSRFLRLKHPHLRSRLPSLGSRSYYVGSVGQASEEAVKQYSEARKRS